MEEWNLEQRWLILAKIGLILAVILHASAKICSAAMRKVVSLTFILSFLLYPNPVRTNVRVLLSACRAQSFDKSPALPFLVIHAVVQAVRIVAVVVVVTIVVGTMSNSRRQNATSSGEAKCKGMKIRLLHKLCRILLCLPFTNFSNGRF